MNREEALQYIQEAGTLEDEAERRTRLADLSEGISEVYKENETLQETVKDLEEKNEKLRAANMDLFTRVGIQKTPDEELDNGDDEDEPEKRKFENLFNEKGELK